MNEKGRGLQAGHIKNSEEQPRVSASVPALGSLILYAFAGAGDGSQQKCIRKKDALRQRGGF